MSGFCYQAGFSQPTKPVDKRLFDAIVDAQNTRENIGKFRETGDTRYKRKLPGFVFQANFDESESKSHRKACWRRQDASRLTGLAMMDIDHVDDPMVVWQRWTNGAIDFAHEGILLVYITPSGKGLKVVFKARMDWGNLIDNQHRMAEILGVTIDESCKDSSRLAFTCRREDILFLNEEIFDYENKAYAEKYNQEYRSGNSRATADRFDGTGDGRDGAAGHGDGKADEGKQPGAEQGTAGDDVLMYKGVEVQKIIDAWMVDKNVEPGNRNNTLLLLAKDFRYITTTNAEKLTKILQDLCPWVRQLEADDHNTLSTVRSACDYKYYATFPKSLKSALQKVGAEVDSAPSAMPLPLAEWGARIRMMGKEFPCISEIGRELPDEAMPAALFASAAMFGTLMTRTWYHFYHCPNEERRLNYCVYIIGDPGSGKSFATRLYKTLMAPVIASDQIGYEALNKWKREKNERNTSSKEQKKEKLEKPKAIIRVHPARTSNGVFIEDMKNAVEMVGQRPMHLHLFTFDSELDNNTKLSGGGGGTWIDRQVMELKAFHNEEDGQAYANSDSVMGMFNVYWNFVYTGTIRSLEKKTQGVKGVASGLTTRLAVVPMPKTSYNMMSLNKPDSQQANPTVLTDWAAKLDGVSGELPLWPLVEECWEWTRDHMTIAKINDDAADELLIKRVAYYGIAIAAPFILMRHWQEWTEKSTFAIDNTDLQLCQMALDIQYQTQHYFFGEAAFNYFEDCGRDANTEKRRWQKTQAAYDMLPKVFTIADVERCYNATKETARVIVHRLKKDGIVEKKQKQYHKIITEL